MKTVMMCVVLLMFCGCEEGFTPEQMQELAAQNEVLQVQLDKVQAVAKEIAMEIATAELVDEGAIVRLASINVEIDRLQDHIDVIAQALADVPLTGDATQDFISQLQAANAASGGMNPYAVPVGAGLTVLSMILGGLAKRNAGIAATVTKKYQAHKQGVEKTFKEVSSSSVAAVVEVEGRLYSNIGDARARLGV